MPGRGHQATSRKQHRFGPDRRVPKGRALPSARSAVAADSRLAALTKLASVEIETSMVSTLSGSLHEVFDDVCGKALPIYFGPLLGRLYLEGF
ncbi:MAG: hypothetical protein P4L76_14120 [Beijerinckiaceae bacterium]|nr:hypothetical protein [Beijerinckiaceae bacterium]